ncbi:acyl-CoA dehydrogenase [Paraburkholderia sp. Tr-20389]|uniref:acyl-CoA dehydrogenase n=1 Tax=Paraburkholderia sp. Tr-20389 TaxID=2703903 RepID=UPI00197ECE1F|nr:acyl-CoA dehydrogenase [Paraburkholderia sp. Tr-20389]MBN3757750.1 acyl-CoA dehydrogenase [Paraburkholderia sp. Tr-20389]
MSDIGHDPLRRAAPAAWYINSGLRLKDEEPGADIEPRRYALVPALERYLASVRYGDDASASRAATLDALRGRGMDWLPLPGRGETATRWRGLAAVAACDLSLVKLYEAHTDALAILAELDRAELADDGGGSWAVWAAEPPNAKLIAHASNGRDGLTLEGVKPWCSGAPHVSHALVTAWRDDEPVLAAVELSQPSIAIDHSGWHAVGMRATGTSSVRFDGARAVQVGGVGAYLSRPGFWHGGAGIAACWYGCAAALASILRDSVKRHADPHACAHLGAADAELSAVAALLRESAAWIDAHPRDDAQQCALRVRVAVEQAAAQVMEHVSRALGAVPFCTDAWFAHAIADLPVFLRQSHAERDECALGQTLLDSDDDGGDAGGLWNLAPR